MTQTIHAPNVSRNIPDFIRIAHEHAAHDRFIGGEYTNGMNACFIGCYAGKNDPAHIERTFGIPVALTRLCEAIFERLPNNADRNVFGPAVGDAIAVDGKDFSMVVPGFLHDMLGRLPGADLPHIKNVRDLWDRVIAGEAIDGLRGEFEKAAYAAAAAGDAAAAYAAYAADAAGDAAAAYAAYAADAAYAAEVAYAARAARAAARAAYAAYAARAAARAARAAEVAYAAARAAYAAEVEHQRVTILRLLSEAPMMQATS